MEHRELWQADGEVIRHQRAAKAWSRFELAVRAGVSPHSVAKAERGERLFPSTLACIAAALGIDAMDLRVGASSIPTGTHRERMLIDRTRAFYDAYHKFSMACDTKGLCGDMRRRVDSRTVWSASSNRPRAFDHLFHGRDGVTEFFEMSMQSSRRAHAIRFEEMRCIGNDTVLAVGTDRLLFPEMGVVNAVGVTTATFDGSRIVRYNQWVQILSIAPLDNSGYPEQERDRDG